MAVRCFAIFPRQMVVFVRIPGCSSLCVFAKYFNRSPLIFLSFNCHQCAFSKALKTLGITTSTARTVCSRITGTISVNPLIYYQPIYLRDPNHIWKHFVIDDFGVKTFYDSNEIFKKCHSYTSFLRGKHSHDNGLNVLFEIIV